MSEEDAVTYTDIIRMLRGGAADGAAINQHVEVPPVVLLSADSKRLPTPVGAGIELWPHQQAMLARCVDIEQNPAYAQPIVKNKSRYRDAAEVPVFDSVPIGVMNDPPGAGKTYAILGLIAQDTEQDEGVNLIVVPQNIFSQWEHAISSFFGPMQGVKCKMLNNYSDIIEFYGNAKALSQYRVVLVNDIYSEPLSIAINDNHVKIRRLIIDEIDGVHNRLYTPIQASHVWLVSASYVHQDQIAVGPYMIKTEDVPRVFCKCDPQFIAQSLHFDEPVMEKILCEDKEIQLFVDIVPDDVLIGLNTDDRRPLVKHMGHIFPPQQYNLVELANIYISDLGTRTQRLEEYEKTLEDEESSMTEYEIFEYNRIIQSHCKMRRDAAVLKKRISELVPSDPAKVKSAIFKNDICSRILSQPDSKWLIFNDNASSLYQTADILKARGIQAVMLDGGNDAAIAKTIKQYKEGSVQVLLLNSKMEGAGMNLENTSHLLFMHKTDPRMVEQVVGRSQRYGRKGVLHIITLYNHNEDE
jgi:SNF2 family DNA or RNA helicase